MRSTATTKKQKRVVNLRLDMNTIQRAKEIARVSGSTESDVYRAALAAGLDYIEQLGSYHALTESIMAHGRKD